MKKRATQKLTLHKSTLNNMQQPLQIVGGVLATNIPEVCSRFDCATVHRTCRTCWSRCGSCTTCVGQPC